MLGVQLWNHDRLTPQVLRPSLFLLKGETRRFDILLDERVVEARHVPCHDFCAYLFWAQPRGYQHACCLHLSCLTLISEAALPDRENKILI